jgi:hypothetical protein
MLIITLVCLAIPLNPVWASASDTGDQIQPVQAVRATLSEARAGSLAGLTLDQAEHDGLLVTAMDRSGRTLQMEFELDVPGVYRPVFGSGISPQMFGADLKAWMGLGFGGDLANRLEWEPLTPTTPSLPHDDVSVFIVDDSLVFVALWQAGSVTGLYYGVDLDEPEGNEEGGQSRASEPDKAEIKRTICNRLLDVCMEQEGEYWIFACAFWLYFCAGD